MPTLLQLIQQIIAAARRAPRLLASEDVIALEQQTALLPLAEYIAHRQILQMASRLEEGLPRLPPAPSAATRDAPTRLFDEDAYPVGGYSSLSTRGSIESLLHSQLAYMEPDRAERPDLFDIKYLRDELYYYSRDENRFLRRRRTFLFILQPDLTAARFKDAELPFQRSVLVLAMLLAACRKLADWLSTDGLTFEFLFAETPTQARLEEEFRLLQLLFPDQIENRTVRLERMTPEDLQRHVRDRTETSLTRTLVLRASEPADGEAELSDTDLLVVTGPRPMLVRRGPQREHLVDAVGVEAWSATLTELLQDWV